MIKFFKRIKRKGNFYTDLNNKIKKSSNKKYQRIRDLREDADLTQQEIADKIGLYLTTYRRYEAGENEVPLNIAVALSQFYNISIDYIAGLIEEPRPLYKSKESKVINIKNNGGKNTFNIKQ